MYGYPDNSKCKVCGDRNDPCLHISYSDKTLFKELERRGYLINASKKDIDIKIKTTNITKKYRTELK